MIHYRYRPGAAELLIFWLGLWGLLSFVVRACR